MGGDINNGVELFSEEWKWNPKVKGSGIIECIPQTGRCPNNCDDCFFQSGRSYLEPLDENLPHIPTKEMAKGRIVRVNDGNDSNNQRELVEKTAKQYKDYFFNTAIPANLSDFPGPVVLTINPGKMTDTDFHKVFSWENLMFVRIRTSMWNIENIVKPAIKYYTQNDGVRPTPVVLTFMAYYNETIPEQYKDCYMWKKRTLNSYWCPKQEKIDEVMAIFKDNPYVYACGYKGQYSCSRCGNCLREYYNAKERVRTNGRP